MATPCYCNNIRIASRKVSALYDAGLAPFGINIAQYSLLRLISTHSPVSITRLAHIAELERSTVGRNITILERIKLVQTGRAENDRRETEVVLSDRGNQVLQEAVAAWQECQTRLLSRVGEDKIAVLNSIIDSL